MTCERGTIKYSFMILPPEEHQVIQIRPLNNSEGTDDPIEAPQLLSDPGCVTVAHQPNLLAADVIPIISIPTPSVMIRYVVKALEQGIMTCLPPWPMAPNSHASRLCSRRPMKDQNPCSPTTEALELSQRTRRSALVA